MIIKNNADSNNNAIEGCGLRYFNLLTALWAVLSTCIQVAKMLLCANHVQHIMHLCVIVLGETAQPLILTVEITYILGLFY